MQTDILNKPDEEVYKKVGEENTIELKEITEITNWANAPKVNDIQAEITDALIEQQDQITKINEWLDYLHGKGVAKPNIKNKNGTRIKSTVVPKLVKKHAEWRYSALAEPFLSTDDLFSTEPVTYEDKKAAIQNGLVLNNQFNTKIDKVKFINDYVHTAVDEGTVIIRTGWEYEEEIEQVEEPILQRISTIDNVSGLVPSMSEQVIQIGTRIVNRTKVISNKPTVEVCNNANVIIDPTCYGDLDKAQFIVYEYETSISELKKKGKYYNLDYATELAKNNKLSSITYAAKDNKTFQFKDKSRQKIVVREYWGYYDIDGDGIAEPIVIELIDNIVIYAGDNPFPDKKPPFVLVQYLHKPFSIYGEPDCELLKDNQNILGAVTRGIIDIMGSTANGQVGLASNFLDAANRQKYLRGDNYEFNPNAKPVESVFVHKSPEIPNTAEYMLNMINNESDALTGVKSFNSGISGQALGSTATGIRSALDASSKRELNILRRLSSGLVKVARKIVAMNGEFLSEEEIVRVTNDEFIPVKRDDLAGNIDIKITVSTAEADNQKAQELAFMLQTTAQSSDPEEVRMIRAEIARLRNMPELAKKIEQFQPQPDPYDQQMKMLEMELLKAKIANEKAKGLENQVDAQFKQARTQKELANAKMLGSKADMQDLEFIQKQAGEDIERQKALENEKKLHQLDLKAADTMLQKQ